MNEDSDLYDILLLGDMITGQKEEKSRRETSVPLYTDTHTQLCFMLTEAGVNRTICTLSLLTVLLLNWQLL